VVHWPNAPPGEITVDSLGYQLHASAWACFPNLGEHPVQFVVNTLDYIKDR
jgi:hypothetical protein